jgi:transcriptional regulator with XRE-family HTH domain
MIADELTVSRSLGAVLQDKIKQSGYYVSYMAEDLRLNRNTVYMKLHGKTPITVDELNVFCEYLDADAGKLLNRAINKSKEG